MLKKMLGFLTKGRGKSKLRRGRLRQAYRRGLDPAGIRANTD